MESTLERKDTRLTRLSHTPSSSLDGRALCLTIIVWHFVHFWRGGGLHSNTVGKSRLQLSQCSREGSPLMGLKNRAGMASRGFLIEKDLATTIELNQRVLCISTFGVTASLSQARENGTASLSQPGRM